VGRADAGLPGLHRRVLHERDERPLGALRVAEPEMACVGVVVVVALAHEREAQHVPVERRRAPQVGADGRDVVKALQTHPARLLRLVGHALGPRRRDRATKAVLRLRLRVRLPIRAGILRAAPAASRREARARSLAPQL
jgi:uncharacterized protein YjeT (DUF2065 family)